ncbi:hypothetical protein CDD80_531 [Ophiocordyceps camponoti-rufipedis]|uniref:Uncharacterized protein n=1 Tax=Ophiocordyceps camponoti-rufipedis TaxID=2004952 RepID=A0A2C5XP82_9HYPO|nr:hypothetical protein CDD80_531 [Ophiocordyceps camponoti-rufipedis]
MGQETAVAFEGVHICEKSGHQTRRCRYLRAPEASATQPGIAALTSIVTQAQQQLQQVQQQMQQQQGLLKQQQDQLFELQQQLQKQQQERETSEVKVKKEEY